ncbi:hypothetical protein [Duganella sp. Leaf61]|uniref:hypothetical protein n=1 Tax=Duganella sp. Leaf61 TaxID=1736227 RepID=UPI0012E29F75|nr:hypothetical protein [Duganella sp. Leaf61]
MQNIDQAERHVLRMVVVDDQSATSAFSPYQMALGQANPVWRPITMTHQFATGFAAVAQQMFKARAPSHGAHIASRDLVLVEFDNSGQPTQAGLHFWLSNVSAIEHRHTRGRYLERSILIEQIANPAVTKGIGTP